MAQLVEFARGDAGPDLRRYEIEHFRGEAARDVHFFDFFWTLNLNGHLLAALKEGAKDNG
jgi:hypothetical protein